MQNLIKVFFVSVTIVFVFFLGLKKDATFIEYNQQISWLSSSEIAEFSGTELQVRAAAFIKVYLSKWLLSFLLYFVYMMVAITVTWMLYGNLQFALYSGSVYIALLIISFISVGFGWMLKDFQVGYTIAHRISLIAHSPVLIMVIVLSLRLLRKKGPATGQAAG